MRVVLIIASIFLAISASAFSVASAESYTIGPGDVLEISVWRDDSLSRDVVVPPDGVIAFPLIGDVDTLGLSVTDLRKVITEKISEFVPDASVSVILKQVKSLKAYVIGKVNKPGAFDIGLNTSVIQILAMANGLNPFASERDIHVIRVENGEPQKIHFDYKEVLKAKKLGKTIILKRGDVVVVP